MTESLFTSSLAYLPPLSLFPLSSLPSLSLSLSLLVSHTPLLLSLSSSSKTDEEHTQCDRRFHGAMGDLYMLARSSFIYIGSVLGIQGTVEGKLQFAQYIQS